MIRILKIIMMSPMRVKTTIARKLAEEAALVEQMRDQFELSLGGVNSRGDKRGKYLAEESSNLEQSPQSFLFNDDIGVVLSNGDGNCEGWFHIHTWNINIAVI
mmetsp:Transcript_7673/g.11189  ORF Transcript_7673/g.11189 Transcript_7673/m.11189 type:complete len:103 (-) Transcript_7673:29-337(-)